MDRMICRWYFDCIQELSQSFGRVLFDDLAFKWILIDIFPLPNTFHQTISLLLIKTPGENIENYKGYNFYMDQGLKRQDNEQNVHLIERSHYNDLKENNFARLSYHLKSFRASYPIHTGDTLLDVCQSLYHFLGRRW